MTESASFRECDVVIVNYNAGSLLADCLSSALANGPRRAIVVDNGSTDGSLERLEEVSAYGRVSVVRNGGNLGFAAACNLGARDSSADRILFLNPDCLLSSDTLSLMLEALDHSPEAGMAGGMLCNPEGSEQAGGRRVLPTPKRAFMRAFGLSPLGRFLPGLFPDFLLHGEPLPTDPIPVDAISGACMLVKREAMEDVGPWDEGYFLHCEDLDWCMRFRQKGWKILFVPDAKVVHHQGTCSRSRPVFVEWHKHKGMMRFYRKFFRDRYPKPLWALVALGVWMRFSLIAGYYGVRRAIAVAGTARG